jgi:predicted ribosome quality control (RQC) complex YloA/Tae2 family protein
VAQMPFDGVVVSNITYDLNKNLAGARIEKIYQPGTLELVLNIHSNRKNFKLIISAVSSNPRIHFTESNFSNPESPLSFCMLLRKHIQNGKILSVNQVASERIVEIIIESKSEMGFPTSKKLTIEIMGKHSNIILIDPLTNKIIDSIKRIHEDVNRYRQLLPGFQYVYPSIQSKKSFFEITESEFLSLFNNSNENNEAKDVNELSKCLLDGVQGLSPIICREICSTPINYNLWWVEFSRFVNSIKNGVFNPVSYTNEDNEIKDFYSFPLKVLSSTYVENSVDELSKICDDFYKLKDKSNFINSKVNELEKLLLGIRKKLVNKIEKLNQDIAKAEIDIEGKIYGELLMANLYRITQEDEFVVLENYYNGEEVKIFLNTKLSPSKNAQVYFKKFAKSKKAKIEKFNQIAEAESEIIYIDSILTHLSNSNDATDIEETKAELIEAGYMRAPKVYTKIKKAKFQPLVFQSIDGNKIMVGKNNKENDYLTFKLASRNDIWLHTKDIPGSHVIIFGEGKEISDESINFAAQIAAFYSKAKLSANVPVDYTIVKNIKKPAGAKPGMVIFVNNKTIYVNPSIPSYS